ncbi:hypothetical protein C8J57DRAFT_1510989 [Mycena rebaudengoi]|nr:hypothetical protein C8J57DRAFT_1510989 [Mycena rebaudengoi]
MACVEFGAQMTPADFIHHLEQHPDFLALLEYRSDFFPPQSPNDCFRTTHRIERACAGCGSATVEGDFRARIIGQLAEAIQSLDDHHTFTLQAPDWTAQGWEISVFHDLWARQLGVLNMTEKDIEIRDYDHHTFTLQAPDWTAQGWEISVFHDLWARQLGVLNMTEKDIEIRAWLQKLSPRIESWSSKARIKVNIFPGTIYSWPVQPGVLATSTWVHQAGSELHHWQGRTFVLECTFHCAVVDREHLVLDVRALHMQQLYPAIYAP